MIYAFLVSNMVLEKFHMFWNRHQKMFEMYENSIKKFIEILDLLEDLKMPQNILHINFNFAMIYIMHKILVLLKNHLKYLKDIKIYFFTTHKDENFKALNTFKCWIKNIT